MAIQPLSCVYGNIVIQQRYVLAFMTFMAIVNCYNTRMCLHMAITEITIPAAELHNISHECPGGELHNTSVKKDRKNWTEHEQGIILLSFFPGYLILHLPGGILADKYGGRHVLSSGVLASAIITFFTPLVIENLSYHWLAFSRFLLGLAQAAMYPSITALLSRWVPERQRSLLGSLVYSGIQVGIVTGTMFSGLLISAMSWQTPFYVWSALCVLWYVFFLLMCFSEPAKHPFITSQEAEMLEKEIGRRERFKTPWKSILSDATVWALVAGQCGHDWITYIVEIDMPKYFSSVLHFDVAKNGIVVSAPFIGMWFVSAITGWISDRIINKNKVSIANMRKIYTTISSAGPSILSLVSTYMGCHANWVVAFFWIGLLMMGPYYPGLKVNVLDLSHNFCGILMSLSNGIGVITGIAAPYLVAVLAEHQTIVQWQQVFWVTFAVCTVTNVIYIVWGSGSRAEWDHSPEVWE